MVHLQDSPFIHDELPHVGRMTQTRGLWLFGDGLTDGDLEFLPFDAMLRLTVLDLAENRLERVPPRLVGCHCLEWLSLRANPHLSEVLPELGTLSALRTLDLRQTAVTEASLASLREELPGCTVLV